MIRLTLQVNGGTPQCEDFDQPLIRIGRSVSCDIAVPADNVSSQHATIAFARGAYTFTDLGSTNGSIILRGEERILLEEAQREVVLRINDRICLASMDNILSVDEIRLDTEPITMDFGQTIIAEAHTRPNELESDLGEDSPALRATVMLARELVTQEDPRKIGELACRTCLEAFPRAMRAFFLIPAGGEFKIAHMERRGSDVDSGGEVSALMRSRPLLDRCLADRKGFMFLFEENQVQAIATMIASIEDIQGGEAAKNRAVICCPLFHQERCYGFLEVEAPHDRGRQTALERRDLSLVTLISHLVSGRLYDLENQRERLKLARKATAGFLSATVGHCFKNLLFVPMSLSKMIPLCLKQGKTAEVEWMLARNSVNIRYLDILSNEFAAASKDPTEGFEELDIGLVLKDAAELINQIAPDKVGAELSVPDDLPLATIHGAGVKRLLMNLTLNAVDAVFGQGNREEKGLITLMARYNPQREMIGIVVKDNGPGIPEEILKNLRSIYNRVAGSSDALGELQAIAEQVHSTKEQGFKEHYGLGFLFVCQTVHQHKGMMTIDSDLGHGACFNIILPRDRNKRNLASTDTNA